MINISTFPQKILQTCIQGIGTNIPSTYFTASISEGRSHFTKQTDPIRPESGKRKVCTKQAVFRALLKMRGGRLCREESDSPCQT